MHKIEKCPINTKGYRECYPTCSITNGFGGAGAYSDGKFNITTEFGGWLGNYMEKKELIDLITYVDDINLSFGATLEITNPDTPATHEIEKKAMAVGLKLLKSKVRHLGTEENLKILTKIYYFLKEKIDMKFTTMVKDIIVEDGQVKVTISNLGDIYEYDEKNYQLIGKNTHKTITLGTKLSVKCISANMQEKKIEFEMVKRI